MKTDRRAKAAISKNLRLPIGLLFVIWLLMVACVGKISEQLDPHYLSKHLFLTLTLLPI